jgi:hypothetical protein
MPFTGKTKKLYLLLLIFAAFIFRAQTVSIGSNQTGSCGTKLPPNYLNFKKNIITQTQNMVSTLDHDTCLNKKFSIVFYVVMDSLTPPTWGGISPSNLADAVDSLNVKFKRLCVGFMNCSTVVIHNYVYNNFQQVPHEMQITSNWYTTQTINIYLVNNIIGGGNLAAYTYMPGTPGNKDLIVMRKNQLNTKHLFHVIGHFFGLPDTYAELTNPNGPSQELVARTNCYTNGDGFCDTEADPNPAGFIVNNIQAPCYFLYGPQDAQSKYYTPPVDNYMSDYFVGCRCRYTQEQYNFMARVILTQRLYLH